MKGKNDKNKWTALEIILESEYLIGSIETDFHYMRRHDGLDGEKDNNFDPVHFLSVFTVGYGDTCIIYPPAKKDKMWCFRICGQGGGQSPRVYRALIVLMEAIRRDNLGPIEINNIYADEKVKKALAFILEENYWIETIEIGKTYERMHDDAGGSDNKSQYLSLMIDTSGNSDIHIIIHSGKYRTLRFRMSAAGGKSERVRKALGILMEAIRRDNEDNPEL